MLATQLPRELACPCLACVLLPILQRHRLGRCGVHWSPQGYQEHDCSYLDGHTQLTLVCVHVLCIHRHDYEVQKTTLSVPQVLSTYFFFVDVGSLISLKLTRQARMTGQLVPEICLSASPAIRYKSVPTLEFFFPHMTSGDQPLVLELAKQALY